MPTDTETLFSEFEPVSTAEWQGAIERDLKGGDSRKLLWQTDEGITVRPFYRAEDVPELRSERRHAQRWHIRYEISVHDPAEARAIALAALARGAEQIAFAGTNLKSSDDVRTLTNGIDAAVHFRFAHDAGRVLEILPSGLRGSIDYDPVLLGADLSPTARRFFGSSFCALTVRGEAHHNAGATAVEELAFALAGGAHYIREIGEPAAREMVFDFAATGNYFFDIAKLRAARRLWADLHSANPMRIHTRTSMWNRTIYDAPNNLLRGTTEAMAAIIGGTDALTVGAFDEAYRSPTEFSRRLAVNTQLILRDEAHFDKVADPGAGSWYIEWLTRQVVREALELFEQVQAEGGLPRAVESGFVERTLARSREAKLAAIAQRRRVLVGTNQYPNPREIALPEIRSRVPGRAVDAFEQIRLATERSGRRPQVLLIPFGELKMRRARADFVTNFFGVAGFTITEPAAFATPDAAAEYANSAPGDLLVLCSSDAEYPAFAKEFTAKLVTTRPVLAAGQLKDSADQLRAVGVRDFIHVKSDPIATLKHWQRELGVIE
ncbi:MAG TPA: methylmalonyl-CoA mutase family protein [Bryobacteraceae bacterium]|nr:methylmalonyl-CoA mutase family protein [Bryobacteraceae bacterium]